jgi:PEP-CTERM motif-containing protein
MVHSRILRIALIIIALNIIGLLPGAPGIAAGDLSSGDLANPIPEPSTLTLLVSSAAALGGINWLRRRKK